MANDVIDRVSIEIEATAKGASNAISSVESELKRLKAALSGIDVGQLKNVQNALSNINSSVNSAASNIGKRTISPKVDASGMTKAERTISNEINKIEQALAKMQAYKNAALSGDSSSMTSFQRQLVSTQGLIDALGEKLRQAGDSRNGISIDSDSLQDYRDRLAEIQSRLDSTSNSVSGLNSKRVNIDTSFIQSGLSDVASLATKAGNALKSMASAAIKSGLNSIKSALSGIKSALSNVSSLTSKLGSTGFMKILKYGFGVRSLYVLFRRLRQAIKDSFTELQKSGADFETTKANVEALKNSLTTLKYQFGAAFEPIFNTVAPALQTLINYLVAVMNTISAFIAKLTGKNTYSKAVAATGTIAKNTGSAAGSAKELNKQLQGFDELNNLSGDSGSSGGGGSGSGSGSDVTYVEESVDNALSTFWDSLADALTNGEWEKAGSLISEKLTSALNSINWNDVYQGAANFGTGLAQFLNGLITDDLFSAVGKTIANSINTALVAAYTFSEELNWSGLGTAVASAINSFVENNSLNLAAATFSSWANGILEALIKAVETVKWEQIRDKVSDSINRIDTTGIGDKFGTLVNGLANALYTLVSDKKSWNNLGKKIGEGINAFLDSMSTDNGSGMNGWTATSAGLSSLASGIISSLATQIKTTSWSDVAKGIGDMINGIKAEELGLSLGNLVSGISNALYTLLSNKDNWSSLGTKIGEGINGALSSMSEVNSQTGLTGWQALGKDISEVFKGISTAFETALDTIDWDEVKTALGSFLKSINIDSIAVVISDIAVTFMLGEAAKTALLALLSKEAMSVIGGLGTVTVGQVAVAVTLSFVIGWQIGGKLYESATGYEGASQGFIDTVTDIWNGIVGKNRIKFNLLDFIDFTIGDIGNGDGWLKDTSLYASISKIYNSIKDAFSKIFSGNSVSSGYNGAPSEAVKYIEGDSKSWSEIGKNIIDGIIEGWKSLCTIANFTSPVVKFKNALIGALEAIFKIGSPAKAMYEYGEYIFEGIIKGFEEKMKSYNFFGLLEELYEYFNTDTIKKGQTSSYKPDDIDEATEKLHTKTGLQVKINTKLTGDAKSTDDLSKLTDSFRTLTNEAGKGATSKFDTSTDTSNVDQSLSYGGMSKARTKWGKTTTSKFDTNPDTSKVEESMTSGGMFKAISRWIKTNTAKFDTKPDTSAVDESISKGSYKLAKDNWKAHTVDFKILSKTNDVTTSEASGGAYANAKAAWTGKSVDFKITPNTKEVTDAEAKSGAFTTAKNAWTGTNATFGTTVDTSNADWAINHQLQDLKNLWPSYGQTATFYAKADLSEAVWAQNHQLWDLWNTWSSYGQTATFSASFSYNQSDLDTFVNKIQKQIKEQVQMTFTVNTNSDGKTQVTVQKALGGAFYGGAWHNIPQYARGGKPNHGSLFVAGEAGPEIVGNMNGRTEVLNKSQIAATIHSAFVSSMAQFGNRMLATPESVAIQSGSYSTYSASSNGDGQTAMLAEQNRLLAEQNQLLREIASKDVSISSRDVFNAVKSESNRFNNRTGSSPFLF